MLYSQSLLHRRWYRWALGVAGTTLLLGLGVVATEARAACGPEPPGYTPTFDQDTKQMMMDLACTVCHMSHDPKDEATPWDENDQANCGTQCHTSVDASRRVGPFRVARMALQTDDYESFKQTSYWGGEMRLTKGEAAYYRMALGQMPPLPLAPKVIPPIPSTIWILEMNNVQPEGDPLAWFPSGTQFRNVTCDDLGMFKAWIDAGMPESCLGHPEYNNPAQECP